MHRTTTGHQGRKSAGSRPARRSVTSTPRGERKHGLDAGAEPRDTLSVLVVDDDQDVGSSLETLLSLFGQAIMLEDSRSARAILEQPNRLSVILINVGLNHGDRSHGGLDFWVEEVRLTRHPSAQSPTICYSFEELRSLQDLSQERLGHDLFSMPGSFYVQLPLLASQLRDTVAQALLAPVPSDTVYFDKLAPILDLLRRKSWGHFAHDSRNALGRGMDGWMEIRERIYPEFVARLRRMEGESPKSFLKERTQIEGLLKGPLDRKGFLATLDGEPQWKPDPEEAPIDDSLLKKITTAFSTRILIVEDEPGFAYQLEQSLREQGHAPFTISKPATSTQEILQRAHRNAVEVVLLDLNFGSIENGWKILSAFTAAAPDIGVVMLTGWGGSEFMAEAKRRGASDYLLKPTDPEQIASVIRRMLVKRRVIVIDDELDGVVTKEFVQKISSRRCEVFSFESPKEAYRSIANGEPSLGRTDLVLLDLTFHGKVEGAEAFKELKRGRKDLPIFILTGHGDDETIHRVIYQDLADSFGHDARDEYLVKPLSEAAWLKIWRVLFPDPQGLRLRPPTARRRKERGLVELLGEGGTTLAETWLEPKQWVFLCGLVLKRQRGMETVKIAGWNPHDDADMLDAFKTFDILPELGQEAYVRQTITHINKAINKSLGYDWDLIVRISMGLYALRPQIRDAVLASDPKN